MGRREWEGRGRNGLRGVEGKGEGAGKWRGGVDIAWPDL